MDKKSSNANPEIDVSIIIVSYNVRDYLRDCLKSVYQNTTGISYEIFVVDNASSDGSADMVAQEFPKVKLIWNKQNLGFSKANNIGMKQSKGQYLLLLNPDTIILNNALQKMIVFLNSHPGAGVVGPEILNPNGSVQYSSKNYFPTPINSLLISYILRRFFKTHEYSHSYVTEQTCWVIGSCLMVRKITSEEVGFLNEELTFFFEDADLCYRIVKAGWKVYFLKEAKIIHYGGASWKQLDCPFLLGKQALYQFFKTNHSQLYANWFKLFILLEKIFITFLYMVIPRRLQEKIPGQDYKESFRYFVHLGSLNLPNSTHDTKV